MIIISDKRKQIRSLKQVHNVYRIAKPQVSSKQFQQISSGDSVVFNKCNFPFQRSQNFLTIPMLQTFLFFGHSKPFYMSRYDEYLEHTSQVNISIETI